MTQEILTPDEILQKYRAALAAAKSIEVAAKCLDRALELLPYWAADQNLAVFKEYDVRVAELKAKRK